MGSGLGCWVMVTRTVQRASHSPLRWRTLPDQSLTDPLDPLQILGMGGIRQHGEKVLVTPGTAAVLGRAVPFSRNTGGGATCLKWPPGSLNQDRVLPVVAEVIGVGKAAHAGGPHLVQGQPLLVGHLVEAVGVAILAAGDVEGMEMAPVPAHRRLDRLMQVAQRHLTGDEKASPDPGGLVPESVTLRLRGALLAVRVCAAVLAMILISHRGAADLGLVRAACECKRVMCRPARAWPQG